MMDNGSAKSSGKSSVKKGKVYFVGAGPGATDLITLRGQRLLECADVIVYAGSLVNPALLESAREGCAIYDSAGMTLEEVIDVLAGASEKGWLAVRLHTGDPSLYGGKDAGEAGAAHFRAWRERGAGKIVYSRVETDGSGMYDAELELAFPDGSSMSMHFRCPLRSIWKLSLSFP